ncbi:MAG: hypothetical protein CMO75_03160 [Verrucomicrobiales bacterium]|nr:hypothetical protein [Verrucomicrobiales bacterium]
MVDCLKSILHGFLIGIANIIPGVSGGSIALALGIYERLIAAVGQFGATTVWATLRLVRFNEAAKQCFLEEWRRIDGAFLSWIAIGGAVAVVVFSRVMVWLLEFYHDPTYGFFSGLILVSILIPLKMVRRFGLAQIMSALVALGLVLLLTFTTNSDQQLEDAKRKVQLKQVKMEQAQTSDTNRATATSERAGAWRLSFFVLCGAIAISAMVLPGVSGSFVMILLGVYFEILQAVNERDLVIVSLFALGCGLGLVLFTRLLKWILGRFHDPTIAFLTGLMAGSLVGLWPFRKFEILGSDKVGFERVDLGWVLPPADWNTFATLVAFLVGAGLVIVFLNYDRTKAQKKGG